MYWFEPVTYCARIYDDTKYRSEKNILLLQYSRPLALFDYDLTMGAFRKLCFGPSAGTRNAEMPRQDPRQAPSSLGVDKPNHAARVPVGFIVGLSLRGHWQGHAGRPQALLTASIYRRPKTPPAQGLKRHTLTQHCQSVQIKCFTGLCIYLFMHLFLS